MRRPNEEARSKLNLNGKSKMLALGDRFLPVVPVHEDEDGRMWIIPSLGPEEAETLLAVSRDRQRKLRTETAAQYGRLISQHMWRATRDPVRLDPEMRTCDGQHRLMHGHYPRHPCAECDPEEDARERRRLEQFRKRRAESQATPNDEAPSV